MIEGNIKQNDLKEKDILLDKDTTKDNTKKILSSISDSQFKSNFENDYSKLDSIFDKSKELLKDDTKLNLSNLKDNINYWKDIKLSISEIKDKFLISDNFDLRKSNEVLANIWLDLSNQFNWYDEYIKNNLSNLDKNILDKVYKSIWIKICNTTNLVLELYNNHKKDFKDYRWIINEKVQDELSFVNEKLLPSLAYYSKNKKQIDSYNNWFDRQDRHWKLYALSWWDFYLLESKLREIEEMISWDVNNNWDFIEWNFFQKISWVYTQDILDKSDLGDKRLLSGIPNVDWVDILSDADKELEGDIMIKYLAFVWTMIIPYAWVVTSVPSDYRDAFSDVEWTIATMKSYWLVPEEYQMSKHWYDNVLWVIWLIWTGFWAQWISKSFKFTKVYIKLQKLWLSWEEISKRISSYSEIFKSKVINKWNSNVNHYDFIEIKPIEKHYWLDKGLSTEYSLKINNESALLWKTDEELNNYFLSLLKNNPSVKVIDISDVQDNILKYKLNHIIWLNYPLLNISRLNPWQNVVDITFLWVKDLNDLVSKEFVDLFNWKFKSAVELSFHSHVKEPKHWRLVRSNYKHVTFSLPHEKDPLNILFWDIKSKQEFLLKIFNSISDLEFESSMKNSSKKLSKEEIKSILFDKFDFGVWITRVPWEKWENIHMKQKLESFYKAEISSRVMTQSDNIKFIKYDFETTKNYSLDVFKYEKEVVEKYLGKFFIHDWVEYDIISKLPNWEKVINPYLLRYVRKWKDIWNAELNLLVNNYIDSINNAFDFISPVIKFDWHDSFTETSRIWESIKNWNLSLSVFQKNYKGTYTYKALEKISDWKEWMRVFVDIVDMGIMNLEDFRWLAKKVVNWDITWNNIEELLDAGLSVTKKFQYFIKEIEKIPWSKVSLGWDEVFIFFEWRTKSETDSILSSITEWLNNQSIRWRVAYSFESDNNKVFDNLDGLTKVNKILEKKIEELIVWWNMFSKIPNNITLDIDPKIIWNWEGDYERFLSLFESSVDFVKLLELINLDRVWVKKIWEFEDKVINLKKNWADEYILSITKSN